MPTLTKVAKFGGTSMADAEAMKRSAAIVARDNDKRLIVVSATSGTTNLLTALCGTLPREEKRAIADQIEEKHRTICSELKQPEATQPGLDDIIKELRLHCEQDIVGPKQKDEILACGERMSSLLFAAFLNELEPGTIWFDAREVIATDDAYGGAEPDIEAIERNANKKLRPLAAAHKVVSQGFIGSDSNGVTTTLGRGGSDYSAALLAEALNADVLEIWTDVTAIYTTDPRIEPDAKPLTELSFDEAAELSVFGAKVLHPATLKPAMRKSIKVYVGSSFYPDKPGTWIVKKTKNQPVIRAISLRRNQTLLTVHSLDMLHRHGFLAKLFDVLSKYEISVDLVTTSEVSVSMTLDTDVQASDKNRLSDEVLKELETFCDVEIEENLALIALVGNNLHATAGLSGPVFGSLQDVNIRLICHGASSHNLCFLVDSKHAEHTIRKIHKEFISKENSTFNS
jgi:aspartate kinase